MQLVAHQGRTGMAVHHFGVKLGRFGHDPRLAAGELYRHRLLIGAALRHRQRLPGVADRRLAGDHFRDHERGALAFDDAAERQIGHPRHRRQDDRIFKDD